MCAKRPEQSDRVRHRLTAVLAARGADILSAEKSFSGRQDVYPTCLCGGVAGYQLGNAYAEVVVEHEHFTAGDESAVGIDIDGVAR